MKCPSCDSTMVKLQKTVVVEGVTVPITGMVCPKCEATSFTIDELRAAQKLARERSN